jgi:perosamine synthetase
MISQPLTAAELSDLRYVRPPDAPRFHLHPSRMGAARLSATIVHAARPNTSAARLADRLRAAASRPVCELTNSGRAALLLALRWYRAGPGTEVVLSTFNCPAVADAVLACGATPVFVDFDPDEGPAYDSVELTGRIVVLTNGLGLDEWTMHGNRIIASGGRPVLDLAQAVPARDALRRYAGTGCPIVLSFGVGKPLGGIGGGALLTGAESGSGSGSGPGSGAGASALALALAAGERALQRSPRPVRAMVQRHRRRAAGWSVTKADHLATACGPVPLGPPDRWQVAAAATLVRSAGEVSAAMTALHEHLRATVAGALRTCRLAASIPALSAGVNLIFERRGDRARFADVLADHDVASTWHYFPLHRTPAYAVPEPAMPAAEWLWPRILTLPAQPQPGLARSRRAGDLLARAVLAADRAVAGGHHG